MSRINDRRRHAIRSRENFVLGQGGCCGCRRWGEAIGNRGQPAEIERPCRGGRCPDVSGARGDFASQGTGLRDRRNRKGGPKTRAGDGYAVIFLTGTSDDTACGFLNRSSAHWRRTSRPSAKRRESESRGRYTTGWGRRCLPRPASSKKKGYGLLAYPFELKRNPEQQVTFSSLLKRAWPSMPNGSARHRRRSRGSCR